MEFPLNTEAGYDYDGAEAGLLAEMDAEDDVGIYDEAGILEFIIPGVIANEMKKRGQFPKARPGRRARPMPGSGRKKSSRWRTIFSRLSSLDRRLKALEGNLRSKTLDFGTTLPASPGERAGFRTLLGGTLSLNAPGGVGPANFGPLQIIPTNISQVSSLVAELWEDAAPAAAAGAEILAPTPFVLQNLTLAGSNVIRSANPTVPSNLFQVTGTHYGYPIGTGRQVDLPASAPVSMLGEWNPRTPGGGSNAELTAALLSPRVAA